MSLDGVVAYPSGPGSNSAWISKFPVVVAVVSRWRPGQMRLLVLRGNDLFHSQDGQEQTPLTKRVRLSSP